jgi:hypothetical protein
MPKNDFKQNVNVFYEETDNESMIPDEDEENQQNLNMIYTDMQSYDSYLT